MTEGQPADTPPGETSEAAREPTATARSAIGSSGGSLTLALRDIGRGLGHWRLWTALAWEDLRARYRRTSLGLLWYVLSFLAFLVAKLVIFGTLSSRPFEYFALYLAIGFLVWEFLAGLIVEGSIVFVSAAGWISGVRLPLSLFPLRSITRVTISTLYRLAVVAILYAILRGVPGPVALASLAAFLFILVNALWIQLLVGTISARFRDLQHLIQTGVRIIFFVSPIVWTLDQVGRFGDYLYWNPFYHYIELVRAPLLDDRIPWDSWRYVAVATVIGWIAALAVFSRARRRIVFWL